MKKQLIALTLFTTLLTACGENIQTAEWYIAHPEELKKEVEKCKLKTTEEQAQDKLCQVINKASRDAFWEHQKNAPLPTFDVKKFK